MPNELTVRPVEPRDFEAWKPLWDGYNAGRGVAVAMPAVLTNTTWARFLDASEPMHSLVAPDSGRLLGFAHYLFHRSTAMIEPNCLLQDLFTVEGARGRGVGRALIEAVAERASAAGATRLYWMTRESNTAAMRLYDLVAAKSGFVVYRRDLV